MADIDPRLEGAARSLNEELLRGTIRHGVNLERLKNQLVRDTIVFLNDEVFPDIVAKIQSRLERLSSGGGVWTSKRYADLLELIAQLTADGIAETHVRLEAQLDKLAAQEATWQKKEVDDKIGVDIGFDLPSPEILKQIVRDQPFAGMVTKDWFEKLDKNTADRLVQQVNIGLAQGETVDLMVQRIRGTQANSYADGVLETTRHEAEAIVRTAATHVTARAREATYVENADVIAGVQWSATLDDVTCVRCAALDGQVFKVGEGPRPPAHWNAVIAGSLIQSEIGLVPIQQVRLGLRVLTHAGRFMRVYAVMSKRHQGKGAIELKTSTGSVLRVTHEHPVLTLGRGWIRADQLHAGDQVFEDSSQLTESRRSLGSSAEDRVLLDANNYPSTIDEEPVAYDVVLRSTGVSSAIKLEGNPRVNEGEVDDVCTHNVLKLEWHSARRQRGDHSSLVVGRMFPKVGGLRLRNPSTNIGVRTRVGQGHPGGMDGGQALRRGDVSTAPVFVSGRTCPHGFRSHYRIPTTTHMYPVPLAPRVEAAGRDSHLAFDGSNRLALLEVHGLDHASNGGSVSEVHHGWTISTITTIAVVDDSSSLWNLAVEEDETFVASGVVVHNCRCDATPALKSWKELGIDLKEAPPGTRASANGEVADAMSYADWIKGEDAQTQADVLGATKAKLFRSGALKLEQFSDDRGRILTLDELAEKEGVKVPDQYRPALRERNALADEFGDMADAFKDGWDAQQAGKPKRSPKSLSAPRRAAWLAGWNSAAGRDE